jgi:AcrR family transcriptional regulator
VAPGDTKSARPRLTRQRVLEAAIALADEAGRQALSMRKLGEALGVEAMSLYGHVASKDDLLDAMVDEVFAEIDLAADARSWRTAMRRRAISARDVLSRHPWAVPLMQSRTTPGPNTLGHHDALIGRLRGAGFSVVLTAHALSVLDAYVYGFAMQEKSLPFEGEQQTQEVAEQILSAMPVEMFPHLIELAREHVLQPGYDYGQEFEWGLDLVLDGLDRARRASR